jgi:hypothetical protein
VVGRAVPAWQLKFLRRFPRIAFASAVEIVCGDASYQGTSRNLSTGGMLLDLDCHLPPQTPLCVSFQLPTGAPVKALARVVHCRPGKRLGIEFTHMGNADWNALGKAIEIKESYQRRSIRIPERLMVELHWHQGLHAFHQPAQTILLSRHGCLLLSETAPPPKVSLVIWCVERRMGAAARVVSCEQDTEGLAMVALEFARDANFWGIDFEPWEWHRHRPNPNYAAAQQPAAQH